MERETLTFTVTEVDLSDDGLPTKLMEFSAWLSLQIGKVPAACLPTASVVFESDDYDAAVRVCYTREETDEEMAARGAVRERDEKNNREQNERAERALYEVLKAKYGAGC